MSKKKVTKDMVVGLKECCKRHICEICPMGDECFAVEMVTRKLGMKQFPTTWNDEVINRIVANA